MPNDENTDSSNNATEPAEKPSNWLALKLLTISICMTSDCERD